MLLEQYCREFYREAIPIAPFLQNTMRRGKNIKAKMISQCSGLPASEAGATGMKEFRSGYSFVQTLLCFNSLLTAENAQQQQT